MRADTINGQLDPLLLATVAEEPAHGYAIVQRLRLRSGGAFDLAEGTVYPCLLYTSPSPRDRQKSRMPSSA